MPAEPAIRVSYEIYARVSGERVILHGGIPAKRDAMKLLRDERRLWAMLNGPYGETVSEIAMMRIEWSEATAR